MQNIEVVKQMILSIIDGGKGRAQISIVRDILSEKGITNAVIGKALNDLMDEKIINWDGVFYTRK